MIKSFLLSIMPGVIAVRRKSENTQISFEAIGLSNNITFLRKFQCLLSLGEIEIPENLQAMFSVYVKKRELLIFHNSRKKKSSPV